MMELVALFIASQGNTTRVFSTRSLAETLVDSWRNGKLGKFHTVICTQHGSEVTFRTDSISMIMWERAEIPNSNPNAKGWFPPSPSRS